MVRTLAPIYLAVLVVSVFNAFMGVGSLSHGYYDGLMVEFGFGRSILELMQMVSMLAYFGVLVALSVLTLIVVIQRFYKGLLCDEGYLMFTLPVKPWQLIAAKGTAALVMSLASGLTAAASIVILAIGAAGPAEFFRALADPYLWSQIGRVLSAYPTWPIFVLELLALTIASGLAQLYQLYCSMALGHLANKHRIAVSVAAYVATSMALSFVSGFGMLVLGNPVFGHLNLYIKRLLDAADASLVIHLTLLGLTAVSVLTLAVFFFGTERILSKKLNLE